MDTEWTPGPWEPMVHADGGLAVRPGVDATKADWELIAAAPRTKQERDMLLEALLLALGAVEGHPRAGGAARQRVLDVSREAIEKCRDR